MQGWISMHRKVRNHWIWENAEYYKAWSDILFMVNHKDNKTLFDGKLIVVKRAERITSQVKLSERWGWSRKKVKTFLDLLVTDEMLSVKSTTKGTTLKVLNYNVYQGSEENKKQQNGQQKNSRRTAERTAEEQQKNINNNVKNEKNEKNDNNDNKKEVPIVDVDFKKNKIPYEKIVDLYNDILGDLIPSVRSLTKKRKTNIKVRWKENLDSLEKWEELFTAVEEQDFMLGDNKNNWNATFDWLIKNSNNYVKALERQYESGNTKKTKEQEKRRMDKLYGGFLDE